MELNKRKSDSFSASSLLSLRRTLGRIHLRRWVGSLSQALDPGNGGRGPAFAHAQERRCPKTHRASARMRTTHSAGRLAT